MPCSTSWIKPLIALYVVRVAVWGFSPSNPSRHVKGVVSRHRHKASTSTTSSQFDIELYLDNLYTQTSSIKCPFFKRRAADTVDSLSMIIQFLYIRHKSLTSLVPFQPPGCRAVGRHVQLAEDGSVYKTRGLTIKEISSVIEKDWTTPENVSAMSMKGYYITGKLNSAIYRDDCMFDGPDPDMPVRGLRKYLDAASKLFDSRKSYAELLSLDYDETARCVDVTWRLSGILMLPWHPSVKPWTGKTRYHIDDEGLVYMHTEEWDISVLEAFVCTVLPETGAKIWGEQSMDSGQRIT